PDLVAVSRGSNEVQPFAMVADAHGAQHGKLCEGHPNFVELRRFARSEVVDRGRRRRGDANGPPAQVDRLSEIVLGEILDDFVDGAGKTEAGAAEIYAVGQGLAWIAQVVHRADRVDN